MKGLITFEGIDRSGKSTQVLLLAGFLAQCDIPVTTTQEPGGTPTGMKLKEIVLGSEHVNEYAELFLYLADRSHHVDKIIRPALQAGHIVICDRYGDATVAYQGYGRGLDLGLINQLNQLVTGNLCPMVTFLLDLDPHLAALRSPCRDRIESESERFHRRVRDGYVELAAENPARFVVIDATHSSLAIHEEVKQALRARLPLSR